MKIGIYSRVMKPEHRSYVQGLLRALKENGYTTVLHSDYGKQLQSENLEALSGQTFNNHEDVKGLDLMLAIGGDGTLLDTVQFVRDSRVPVAGINMGRLGFLADIHKDQIASLLDAINKKTYKIEERTLISVEANKPVFNDVNFGLNEFAIHKTDSSAMIVIHVYLNGEFLNSFWADGLIVATPTGSTAYSLSCGGPILFPSAGVFSITPVAPHNLNARPMVVPDDTVLTFEVEGRSNSYLCTIDSRSQTFDNTYQLAVRKAPFAYRLVRMPESSYLKTLREKLRWGEDSRNS
jgi:NAD+ kinase